MVEERSLMAMLFCMFETTSGLKSVVTIDWKKLEREREVRPQPAPSSRQEREEKGVSELVR